ncbi:hypothetical protein IE81DRAFT_162318 [Ceraceosorus guamensis]|uniref:Uncharacterized protein n=1 Tax=Ceraceosorus guamensis TaxID=1522189 RepID=A0A316W6P4_9BASI|nr:hypothetical protein IE81DRAFT_162318 [Ceraceosorus guamensis]PWN45580.1 hypothetical protein IE81DRAFT_162318 [Ceraceosorus guamensis]
MRSKVEQVRSQRGWRLCLCVSTRDRTIAACSPRTGSERALPPQPAINCIRATRSSKPVCSLRAKPSEMDLCSPVLLLQGSRRASSLRVRRAHHSKPQKESRASVHNAIATRDSRLRSGASSSSSSLNDSRRSPDSARASRRNGNGKGNGSSKRQRQRSDADVTQQQIVEIARRISLCTLDS